ncbi:hypothetical protein PAL_GLEAN10011034 [Pteropus alecto]|uniref:Uncharacterized protein n=1 Tax=Pteropus alecto TaxID=9402 RepID=L5KVG6_PTEAL|nr:hypothetical protein PAL_GLEAN10011034 [Pteropus alecto]
MCSRRCTGRPMPLRQLRPPPPKATALSCPTLLSCPSSRSWPQNHLDAALVLSALSSS